MLGTDMAHLIIEFDGQKVTSYDLQTAVEIGRSAECGLSFPISFLSRRHLRLQQTAEGWQAVDLASTNGSWIDRRRITAHLLQDGDVVQLGNLAIKFYEHTPSLEYNDYHNGDAPRAAEIAANPGALSDDEIVEILSRPDADSIDEDPAEFTGHGNDQRLDESLESVASVVTAAASQPLPGGPPKAEVATLWEIAMKPTPQTSPQSRNRQDSSGRAVTKSASEQPNSEKPSLNERWQRLLVRFDTDLRFKGGVTLGILVLSCLGAFYWLQANGFARSDESRGHSTTLNSHAQAASPASRENAIRDLPV
jgi:predicted component of type VI protein secretion system